MKRVDLASPVHLVCISPSACWDHLGAAEVHEGALDLVLERFLPTARPVPLTGPAGGSYALDGGVLVLKLELALFYIDIE